MKNDDLSTTIAPVSDGSPPMHHRQGTVLSWNQFTAENEIVVGNTILTNVPSLNSTEASLITAGDKLALVSTGTQMFVLGRIITPATDAAASSVSVLTNAIRHGSDDGIGYRSSSSWGDLYLDTAETTILDPSPQVTMDIRFGTALVLWRCELGFVAGGSTGGTFTQSGAYASIDVAGPVNIAANDTVGGGHLHTVASGGTNNDFNFGTRNMGMYVFDGLPAGEYVFTMKYRRVGGNSDPHDFAKRLITVIAF